MPTYTYTCTACNDIVEKRQSFSDPPLTTCEQCGGSLRKIIHPVGIVFKGTGWYITDSRSSSNSLVSDTSSSSSPSSASKESTASKSKPAESKTDSSGTKTSSAPADKE